VSAAPAFPLPDPAFEPTRAFWEAAARGELAVPRCAACRAWVWYPREACPCGGALAWTRVSGRGTLFSFAVVRKALVPQYASLVPYLPALVALAEEPRVRLVTRLVDCAPGSVRVDMPLRVAFRRLRFDGVEGEIPAPCFAPES